MRLVFSLAFLFFLLAIAPGAAAQAPPGSYLRDCRDIRVEGDYLSAWCRGSRSSGWSTLNLRSCASDIWVDAQGGLTCAGPGAGPPGPGGAYVPSGPGWNGGWESVTLYEGPGYRGRSLEIRGDMSNLDRTGMNDRVGSIRFGRRSGPWLVCSDAGYQGRCVTVDRNVRDTRRLGMGYSISSLRPLR